ncbi:MAG: hypothetical protein AAF693_12835 [Bacteroidota bacterium]
MEAPLEKTQNTLATASGAEIGTRLYRSRKGGNTLTVIRLVKPGGNHDVNGPF